MPAPSDRGVALALGVGLLLLVGPGSAPTWGAALPLIVLVVAGGLAVRRGRTLAAAGGWAAVLAGLPRGRRIVVGALLVSPMVIVTAVAARAIAGLCVGFPAAVIGLATVIVLAVVVSRVRGRGGPVAGVVAAALAIAATCGAVRFEAAGPGARGFAHSGPILGIHPFQSTAVIVDGYGPFDLPINDYVEPDGSKGYGPEELAEALQRTLHTIAEVHFADGPRRAYEAFAGARVEAVVLPAIQERLDRPVKDGASEPRLVVWSGTTGPRSRVEFVCPGSRSDPRPRQPDAVMERMCPDKYSSEASAGLGLTGRWTGYTEGRGQARLSLMPVVERLPAPGLWEPRAWAWLVLVIVVLGSLLRGWTIGAVRVAGGIVGPGLAVLLVMAVRTWPGVQVGWFAAGPAWTSPWALGPWVAALPVMLAGALGAGWAVAGGAVAIALWAAGVLAAATVLRPGPTGPSLEAWVTAIAARVPVDLATAEAVVATGLMAAVVMLLAVVLGPGARVVAGAIAPTWRRTGWLGVGIAVVAGLVVLSRKTGGGSLLLAPALALAVVATTGLAAAVPGRRWRRIGDHVAMVVVVVIAAIEAWMARGNGFVLAGLVVAVGLAAASLWLLRGSPAPRG